MDIRSSFGGAVLAGVLAIGATGCTVPEDGGTAADRAEVNTQQDKPAAGDKKVKKEKAAAPKESVSQENARESAESYLDMAAFSRTGLIKQLKFEGYSQKDAEYGVDAQKANWNKQAAASAESYLEMSSFSRASLIDQLVFEGFTRAQAEFGADAVGL